MQLKANEVDRYLNKKDGYHPIILVYGPNSGLVTERVKQIISNLNNSSQNDFEIKILDSDTVSNETGLLMDELQSVSLFGDKKIIKLRLNGAKTILSALKVAVENITSDANLIIEAGNLSKGQAVRALIEKSKTAMAVPCYDDDDKSLANIINQEFSKAGFIIDHDAKEALINSLGESRQTSRNEINKLILFGHEKKSISLSDVEKLIGDTSTSMNDEIIDNALIGNGQNCLEKYYRSLSMGLSSYQALHSFQTHLLLLNKLCLAKENNFNISTLIDKCRPPIHFKRKNNVTQQIYTWRSKDIIKIQNYLLETIKECRQKSTLADNLTANFLLKTAGIAKQNKKRI